MTIRIHGFVGYCTRSAKVVDCVKELLLADTVILKVPVGVPLTTLKFELFDEPPPGAGLATTTGKAPVAAKSVLDNGTESWTALTKLET
jgi:hypothetical protein